MSTEFETKDLKVIEQSEESGYYYARWFTVAFKYQERAEHFATKLQKLIDALENEELNE